MISNSNMMLYIICVQIAILHKMTTYIKSVLKPMYSVGIFSGGKKKICNGFCLQCESFCLKPSIFWENWKI